MIGAGTVINPIIKIVTTVAVLAAVYFFIVRPVLDTTESVVDEASKSFQDFNTDGGGFDLAAARSTAEGYASSLRSTWPAAARAVEQCINKAGDNARQMEKCENQAERLVFGGQSDFNFANSYADSLDSQGDSAAADKVRACLKKAGVDAGGVQKCRALADRLLFG